MNKVPRQRVYERALEYAKKNLKHIDVKAGRYDGSQKCHHVARQAVETGEADTIAVALSFLDRSGVNVHYLNKIDGEYVDNVLGYLSKANDYWLIKEGTKEDFKDVNMLKDLQNEKIQMLSKLFSAEEILKYDITIHCI